MNASFSAAIAWLKAGYSVRRAAWPEGQYAIVENGKAWVRSGVVGERPLAGSEDLLAEDWQLVRE